MAPEQLNNLHLNSLYKYQSDDIEKISELLYRPFEIKGHEFLLNVFAILERQQRINKALLKRINDLENKLQK